MQTELYDKRYQQGYMEAWDKGKMDKVREIIRSISLPETGRALDFGCGNGVFTRIIKEELPHWAVFGTEISETAIANARARNPKCTFFSLEEAAAFEGQFQLVFSHHVLEHVDHLHTTMTQLHCFTSEKGIHLHILPCGNEGSLEHTIAESIKNGIEETKDYRFFFEEPGHLRRLSTSQFEHHMKRFGFELTGSFFSNQYWGSVNWITKSSPRFVKRLTNEQQATNEATAKKLNTLRQFLLPVTYLLHAVVLFDLYANRYRRTTKETLLMLTLAIPALLIWPVYYSIGLLADNEWRKRKQDPAGSEMFLIFAR